MRLFSWLFDLLVPRLYMGTPQSVQLTKGYVTGDFVISEDAPPIVTRESILIDNSGGGSDLVIPTGYPMCGAVPCVHSSTESTVTGLLLTVGAANVVVKAGTKKKAAVLAHQPSAINFERIPTVDLGGGAFVAATLKTAIATFTTLRHEPAANETQTQTA